MIIVNAILYLSSLRYSILSFNQLFIIEILPYWFVAKNIGNYRKYDIFFNFRFTGNMIFPSIAENQENTIFTLSVFTKMLFFMQWENMLFLNHEQRFIVRKVLPKLNSNDYWILKTEHRVIIDKRFLRQELFALNNQFI